MVALLHWNPVRQARAQWMVEVKVLPQLVFLSLLLPKPPHPDQPLNLPAQCPHFLGDVKQSRSPWRMGQTANQLQRTSQLPGVS